ncbi:MAG TPA: SIMPL domain-containing protein, partial [Planctomycetia bacterium]|nr:SIMPL domain-containing protein [Planctomycetia bacterium]
MLSSFACVALLVSIGQTEGISVVGSGEVKARPDRLELEIRNLGSAELAADATVKMRDSFKRTVAAYERLKLPNFKMTHLGVSVNHETIQQQQYYGGPQPATQVAKVEIARPTRIVVAGVDKLSDDDILGLISKIVDTAKDTGARIGAPVTPAPNNYYMRMMFGMGGEVQSNSLVIFTLVDPGTAHEKAMELAFADARAKAEKLAKLAGVELGPAASISESVSASVESEAET